MTGITHHVAETGAAATKATITAYTSGAAATGVGLLAQVDWMQAIGIASIIGTFLINWYYKHKDDKRKDRYEEIQRKLAEANLTAAPRDNPSEIDDRL